MARRFWFVLLAVATLSGLRPARAQSFNAAWYRAGAKIAVAADGVYRVTGAELQAAGFPLGLVSQLELVENGRPVPFLRLGGSGAALAPSDTLVFVGRRNTGRDERAWAYLSPDDQSSDAYSLYTDTTFYWLRNGAASSRQYRGLAVPASLPPLRTSLPDTVHHEPETLYFAGDANLSGHPMYTRGEGYYISAYSIGGVQTSDARSRLDAFNISTPNLDAAAQDSVRLLARLAGGSGSRHRASLRIGTNTTDLDTVDWWGYAYATLRASLPPATVASASNVAQVRVRHVAWHKGVSFPDDNLRTSVYNDFVRVSYPRLLTATAGRDDFWMLDEQPVHLRLSGYTGATRVLALLPESGTFADLALTSGTATLAGSPGARSSVFTSTRAALRTPAQVQYYDGPALASQDGADYLIVTTPALRASAEAMAAYHRSASGLSTAIVYQHDVFQQFDFGRPTPLALRRFLAQSQTWAKAPRYVLLWGDAALAARNRTPAAWEVVTFGNAPSDAWLAMESHTGAGRVERQALGRVPVRSNEEGTLFLDKRRAYDTAPAGFWQKRALYVTGGQSPSEWSILGNAQMSWASVAAGMPSAMDTVLFTKRNTSNNDGSFRTAITRELRKGAAWFSYYGHSSSSVLEVNTDYPPDMENAPRLPVFISLGCATGAFANADPANATRTFAEDLLLGDRDGAIVHWGASHLSNTGPSSALSSQLTQIVFQDTLRTLGDVFRLAKERYGAANVGTSADRQMLIYFLLGDPYTRLRIENRPNFVATAGSLLLDKEAPVLADGTLGITARVYNYGRAAFGTEAPTDSVTVRLDVTVPGQAVQAFSRRVRLLDSLDVPFRVPLPVAGAYTARMSLDSDGHFAESDEADNATERRFTVFASGLALASPARYGITGATPTLRVTPLTPVTASVPVLFELDTTQAFASPLKQTHRTSGTTSAAWTMGAPLATGRTYFWRARVDEAGQENVWVNGSFTVDPAAGEGMIVQGAQRAAFSGADVLFAEGLWRFGQQIQDVQVNGGGGLQGTITAGMPLAPHLSFMQGWGLVIIDGRTGRVKFSKAGPTHSIGGATPQYGTPPAETRAWLDAAAASLVPGDVVLLRHRPGLNYYENNPQGIISEADKARIRRLGSTRIDEMNYNHVFTMVHKVGDPSVHLERLTMPPATDYDYTLNTTLFFPRTEGSTQALTAGPARRWTSARASVALPAGTAATLSLLAPDGQTLATGLPVNDTIDLSEYDARRYPTLRFRLDVSDPNAAGTPQLERLYVRFDPVPDVSIDASSAAVAARVDEAAPLSVSVPVVNLGTSAVDVVLRYTIVSATGAERLVRTDTLRGLAPGAPRTATAALATAGFSGTNTLRVDLSLVDFADPVLTNNTLVRSFVVVPDQTPPTFAVTIDGEAVPHDPRPVTNLRDPSYPFVSARPRIEIVVRDEGAVRLLTSPTLATLTVDGRRIPLTHPDVAFTPASESTPEARIVYTPDFSRSDSTHTITLRIFDAAGNEAAGGLYQAHVRVSTATALERVLPYPNPMVESTTFAFRLRGADAGEVDELRLRVFTLSGRLVREFDLVGTPGMVDGGALRIGWNKVRWDGRDADGDRLAPGVYLYRVTAKAGGADLRPENGQDVERLVVVR